MSGTHGEPDPVVDSWSHVTPATVRHARQTMPLIPYEDLASMDGWSPATRIGADEIIKRGWQTRAYPRIAVTPPVDWTKACEGDPTWQYYLHSWEPLGRVLSTYDHTREEAYLEWAVTFTVDWAQAHRDPALESGRAWYDMAVGSRCHRLAYVLDAATRLDSVDDNAISVLLDTVRLHTTVLSDDDWFPAHSNHGVAVSAGQACLARRLHDLPGAGAQREQAHRRLHQILRDQFTSEGVHKEHSPGYHVLVQRTLMRLIHLGLLDRAEFSELSDLAQEAGARFVVSDGHLASLGDSHRRKWPGLRGSAHVTNQALLFEVTGGRAGSPPVERVRAFPESGYFVAREGWPNHAADDRGDWSYLIQTACFHSLAHKQADDLSFIWYDHGSEILVDSGRYGYVGRTEPGSELRKNGFRYDHPARIYVESTHAHNTVEIDGRSYRRRKSDAYGSALVAGGEHAGMAWSLASVTQFDHVTHERVLVLMPRQWLVVLDCLSDHTGAPHDFVQWFHFAPEITVAPSHHALVASRPDHDWALHVVSLDSAGLVKPVRGRRRPRMQGWVSRADRELLPAYATGFQESGRDRHVFATLLAFGDQAPEPGVQRLESSRQADIAWRQDGAWHLLSWSYGNLDTPPLTLRISTADAQSDADQVADGRQWPSPSR